MTRAYEETQVVTILEQMIRRRRTLKVLADPAQPVVYSQQTQKDGEAAIDRAIAAAGWAPLHYDRHAVGFAGEQPIIEPWRFHRLGTEDCRTLAALLPHWCELKPGNKLPMLLSACGALVMVTYLPTEQQDRGQRMLTVNEEHLAASVAAVQNFLLMLTAQGLEHYWSSGGPLTSEQVFEQLGIGRAERLVAAVFVNYQAAEPFNNVQLISGKLRDRRAASEHWSRQIQLDRS